MFFNERVPAGKIAGNAKNNPPIPGPNLSAISPAEEKNLGMAEQNAFVAARLWGRAEVDFYDHSQPRTISFSHGTNKPTEGRPKLSRAPTIFHASGTEQRRRRRVRRQRRPKSVHGLGGRIGLSFLGRESETARVAWRRSNKGRRKLLPSQAPPIMASTESMPTKNRRKDQPSFPS